MKLLWITDPHLDFLPDNQWLGWVDSLAASDALLLGGDLTTGRDFVSTLQRIRAVYPRPITLVIGNHDFYGRGIADQRSVLRGLVASDPRLLILEPGVPSGARQLPGSNIWLYGAGGWGDALAGMARALAMPLNDENYIAELRQAASDYRLDACLRALGAEHATYLAGQLPAIPRDAPAIVILTHVPRWHDGHPSEARALPRLCWVQGGQTIDAAIRERSGAQFLVLSGHTHGSGIFERDNLLSHTGASRYRSSHHNGLLQVEADGLRLERLDGVGKK